MYVDSPSDHVFTLFDELIYGRHPLGREIAGTIGSVRRATHEGVVDHWRVGVPARPRWSSPWPARSTMTRSCAPRRAGTPPGPRADGAAGCRRPPVAAPAPAPRPAGALRVSYRRLSQGNLCLGMPGVARDDPDRWALDLLGAILGDGMGSRLFLELRERRSLVYDVSTFSAIVRRCRHLRRPRRLRPRGRRAVVRAIVRRARPDHAPSRSRPTSSTAPAPTRAAGSSCGWRTPAPWPAGSGPARCSSRGS